MDPSNADSTPVIIGVGEVKNASLKTEDAQEPLVLMREAIETAFRDTSITASQLQHLKSQTDALSIVQTWTWPYTDLPSLLASTLEINPKHKEYTSVGGNQPARLLDEAARRISLGTSKAAILTGGEALASLTACANAGKLPPPGWTPLPEGTDVTSVFSPTTRGLGETYGGRHGIGAPIHVYPLYENAYRHHYGQNMAENNAESAALYADFARVASQHPYAWNAESSRNMTADAIGTVGRKNRMICYPYPLLMNAFNIVNLSAAVILTSRGFARELGVPEEKFVYPLGGAGTADATNFWERPYFFSSPAVGRSLDAALDLSGLKPNDLDLVDFYSCFPIVPKLAAKHLGWNPVKPPKSLTVLGGLTSFGGAGNNYSMHAVTTMTRQLRESRRRESGKRSNGLILANGGVLSYQYVVCLSNQPRQAAVSYPSENPLAALWDAPSPRIEEKAEGEATLETYTVEFERDGKPTKAFIIGRLKANGRRFLANPKDDVAMRAVSSDSREGIGRTGQVTCGDDGRNLFSFADTANL